MDKERKPPRIYECKKLEEPLCQDIPHIEKFDPRSYCHSILSKTEKVCRKAICRKFLKTNEDRTKGEIVCIPRPPCKIKRHFGPGTEAEADDDDEQFFRMFGSQLGLVLDEGTVSETDILKGRFAGQERITRDGRLVRSEEFEEVIDEYGNVVRRRKQHAGRKGQPGSGGRMTPFGIVQDEETAKLLENLSKYLDAEGMAALAAIGGAEICPCCRCTICNCRLRGISSETLLAQRKKALLESKLRSWGKQGYAWSFDYFYKPDFEYFEKERAERQKREDMQAQAEEERAKMEVMLGEDESVEEFFDKTRTDGVAVIEEIVKTEYASVDATPSIREQESQVESGTLDRQSMRIEDVLAEGLEKDLLMQDWLPAADVVVPDFGKEGMMGSLPLTSIGGTLTESSLLSKSMKADDLAIGEYVRSTQRSSIESWVETREPLSEGRRPTTVTGASIGPIDIAFPAAEIQGSIRIVKRKKAKTSASSKKSRKDEEKAEVEEKSELSELDLFTPVLKRKPSEHEEVMPEKESIVVSEIAPVKIPLPRTEREETRVSVVELEELPLPDDIKKLTLDEAAKAKALSRKPSITSVRYTDVCDCLPGLCTCGARHYVFKTTDIGIESKPSTEEKRVQADAATIDHEKTTKEDSGEDISEKSSCICYHPWEEVDELLRVTPAASIDMVRMPRKPRKKAVCTPPVYQKTIIIVKPEAMNFKDVILRAIKKEGLDIINERLVRLTPEQVAEVYSENYGSAYFPMFVQKMSSTPILVLSVAGNYAVDRWKYIIGQGEVIPSSWFYPESMKRRFGIHCDIYGAMRTSADFFTARNEIRYFFPLDIIEPIVIESDEVQDYCDKYIHPTLLKALYKVAEEKPEDPLLFLAECLLQNNPFQPYYLDSSVALAPT